MTLKRRWRCGCEPILENPAFDGQGPCCDVCDNTATCAWVIQSACRHATRDGEFYLDFCTALIKEHDGNCIWTSRWAFADGTQWAESGDPYFDLPMVRATCEAGPFIGKRPPCEAGTAPTVENCSTARFFTGDTGNCCDWADFFGRVACEKGFIKWRMTAISETTATLECLTRDGNYALYLCDDWSCTEESAFTRSSRTAGLQGIPPKLCVAPAERSPTLVCDTIENQCACCDYDFDIGYLDLSLSGCGKFNGFHRVLINRVCSPGALPCGVTYPSPAPCCVFVGSISDDDCSNSIYLVTWCTGSTYRQRVYCADPDNPGCYLLQGETVISKYECRCYGPYIEGTLPPIDCCCDDTPIATECCPDDDTPTTLTWDDGTDTGTVTWGGSNWSGTGDICGCTATGVHLQCLDIGGGTYQWDLVIDCLGGGSQPVATSVTCNPFTVSFSNGAGCDVTFT